ncbi:MAG: H-type lectin domain-containing protein [Pseudomonadota bacterium]
MKKIYGSVTGVDQGVATLFSDFEDGGVMWTSSGDRQVSVPVTFAEPFKDIPAVTVSLELLDMHNGANNRYVISAQGVRPDGFDIVFRTWGDTRIARARAGWMAIGAARGDEDWDVDYGS